MEKRKVVVTGLSAITSLGLDLDTTWKNLLAGKSGVSEIDSFDTTEFPCRIASQVRGFEAENFIDKKEIKKMDRFIQFALAATDELFKHAKIDLDSLELEKFGVMIGSGIGGLPAIERYHSVLLEKGPKKITPFFIPMLIANLASGQVSIRYGLKGPNSCVVTACATGTHSIGDAYKIIERGDADLMVAGGTESVISPLAVGGFGAAKALSTRNDEPEKASRPFDKDRDGFIMGEGAGLLLLESEEHAKARNATIYAQVAGYGLSGDAYHITSPDMEGTGAKRCMEMCLNDQGIKPEEIGYVNAHGTSTPGGDVVETTAIKKVFKEHCKNLAISSTKSMIGHLLGAAGGVEAVFSIKAMTEGVLPPTINLDNPDPECDLDYIPHTARKKDVDVVLSNSFGFGGTNASVAFRK
ncbi:MAG: beta-ketoacyl-ACP synthase II [Nitrospinae bacterium]|nr:beta-ketoacyl-ACP synthase II [Nitrospinota bacterium]